MSNDLYVRIVTPEPWNKNKVDFDWWDDEFESDGEFEYSTNSGNTLLDAMEKAGWPVICAGFREAEMLQTSYIFVCPGDGTYTEIQCNEESDPVVPVEITDRGSVLMKPEGVVQAELYFAAVERYRERCGDGN